MKIYKILPVLLLAGCINSGRITYQELQQFSLDCRYKEQQIEYLNSNRVPMHEQVIFMNRPIYEDILNVFGDYQYRNRQRYRYTLQDFNSSIDRMIYELRTQC